MSRRLLLAFAIVGLPAVLDLSAQQQPADPNAPVSFEAASVKPHTSADGNAFVRRQPGGRFDASPPSSAM